MAIVTLMQSGGDYSTLNAAFVGVGNGDEISIEGTWTVADTTAATVANDNLQVYTDADSRHSGHWDTATNHYRLSVSGNHALTLSGAYTFDITGVAIEQSGTGSSDEGFRCVPSAGDAVTITDCIIWCSNNTDQQDCIYTGFNTTIGTINVVQCDLYGAGRCAINVQNFLTATASGTINVNSCSIWNNGRYGSPANAGTVGAGIKTHSNNANGDGSGFTINVINSIVVENDTGGSSGLSPQDFLNGVTAGIGIGTWNVSYSIDSDNSISTDTDGGAGNLASRTATDNGAPAAGDWVIFEDITTTPYDLRLQDGAENDAQDMHSTATAHGLTIPSADIVGTSRPQNTDYDCGSFEIVAAGGSVIPLQKIGAALGKQLLKGANL